MGSESFEKSATVDRVTTASGSISVFQLAATSLGRDSCCGEGPRPEEVGRGILELEKAMHNSTWAVIHSEREKTVMAVSGNILTLLR